jgi:glycosyltransferase involved in cell wall biosynthesis
MSYKLEENLMTSLVSILIPVFNGEKYIVESITSILGQSYSTIEVIVVNDGSTDNTKNILNELSKQDSRLRVFHCDNKGLVKTLNFGIDKAEGKFVARMDADDISHKNRIELQYNEMIANEKLVICGSWYQKFGHENKVFKLSTESEDIKLETLLAPHFCHPAVMMRTDVLKQVLYKEDYNLAEDYKLWVDLMDKGEFFNIPQILLDYRVHPNQVSSNLREDQSLKHLQVAIECWSELLNIDMKVDFLRCILFKETLYLQETIDFIESLKDQRVRDLCRYYLFRNFKNLLFNFGYLLWTRYFFVSIYHLIKKQVRIWKS